MLCHINGATAHRAVIRYRLFSRRIACATMHISVHIVFMVAASALQNGIVSVTRHAGPGRSARTLDNHQDAVVVELCGSGGDLRHTSVVILAQGSTCRDVPTVTDDLVVRLINPVPFRVGLLVPAASGIGQEGSRAGWSTHSSQITFLGLRLQLRPSAHRRRGHRGWHLGAQQRLLPPGAPGAGGCDRRCVDRGPPRTRCGIRVGSRRVRRAGA